jgi:hypothetical protein
MCDPINPGPMRTIFTWLPSQSQASHMPHLRPALVDSTDPA